MQAVYREAFQLPFPLEHHLFYLGLEMMI